VEHLAFCFSFALAPKSCDLNGEAGGLLWSALTTFFWGFFFVFFFLSQLESVDVLLLLPSEINNLKIALRFFNKEGIFTF